MKTDYLLCFINRVIYEFQNSKDHGQESFIIPPDYFGTTNTFISIEIFYFKLNELNQIIFKKRFTKLLMMVPE